MQLVFDAVNVKDAKSVNDAKISKRCNIVFGQFQLRSKGLSDNYGPTLNANWINTGQRLTYIKVGIFLTLQKN